MSARRPGGNGALAHSANANEGERGQSKYHGADARLGNGGCTGGDARTGALVGVTVKAHVCSAGLDASRHLGPTVEIGARIGRGFEPVSDKCVLVKAVTGEVSVADAGKRKRGIGPSAGAVDESASSDRRGLESHAGVCSRVASEKICDRTPTARRNCAECDSLHGGEAYGCLSGS